MALRSTDDDDGDDKWLPKHSTEGLFILLSHRICGFGHRYQLHAYLYEKPLSEWDGRSVESLLAVTDEWMNSRGLPTRLESESVSKSSRGSRSSDRNEDDRQSYFTRTAWLRGELFCHTQSHTAALPLAATVNTRESLGGEAPLVRLHLHFTRGVHKHNLISTLRLIRPSGQLMAVPHLDLIVLLNYAWMLDTLINYGMLDLNADSQAGGSAPLRIPVWLSERVTQRGLDLEQRSTGQLLMLIAVSVGALSVMAFLHSSGWTYPSIGVAGKLSCTLQPLNTVWSRSNFCGLTAVMAW